MVKKLHASVGGIRDAGLVPGSGRSLEEGMATHSSVRACRIPWTEEPGGLRFIGSQRGGHVVCIYLVVSCRISSLLPSWQLWVKLLYTSGYGFSCELMSTLAISVSLCCPPLTCRDPRGPAASAAACCSHHWSSHFGSLPHLLVFPVEVHWKFCSCFLTPLGCGASGWDSQTLSTYTCPASISVHSCGPTTEGEPFM